MNKIKDLRTVLKLSQQQLADMVGSSQPQIRRLENDERTLSKAWAERLAPHLGTTPEYLLFGLDGVAINQIPVERPEPSNARIGSKIEGDGKLIPVYGQAVGGVDGEFVMNGIPVFEVMAPPSLRGIDGAYAVTVSGDSMYPRYEDGEVCFVDPKRRVKKGDYVIAQLRLEEEGPLLAYVKKFIRHNAQELVLEQFNPAKEMRFDANCVHSVHYIGLAGPA